MLLAARRAVVVNHAHVAVGEPVGKLLGVGDGGGAGHDLRSRAVELGDAQQPPQHVGQVAAEDAAIDVQLVEHDEAQVLEQSGPLRVVRQNALVEHVGVGDDDVPGLPYLAPRGRRRVTVIGEGLDIGVRHLDQRVELVQLVLRQGLGGEEVERAGLGVVEDGLDDWHVVAEGLARGRAGDDADVFAVKHLRDGLGLVGIKLADAALLQGLSQDRRDAVGPGCMARLARGPNLPGGDAAGEVRVAGEAVGELGGVHAGAVRHLIESSCAGIELARIAARRCRYKRVRSVTIGIDKNCSAPSVAIQIPNERPQ